MRLILCAVKEGDEKEKKKRKGKPITGNLVKYDP